MVRLEDGAMTVRPLAGTRPRGKTPSRTPALERELLADPKERAEHVMLIDLGRNDVGRVARDRAAWSSRGSMEIERYSHVMHIVSEVRGTRADATTPPLEVVRAAFPAGTLSGAPKVRAMQIIRELEARAARHLRRRRRVRARRRGTSTSPSRSARPCARATRSRSRRAPASSRRAMPKSEAEETRSKARAVLCAIEAAPQT